MDIAPDVSGIGADGQLERRTQRKPAPLHSEGHEASTQHSCSHVEIQVRHWDVGLPVNRKQAKVGSNEDRMNGKCFKFPQVSGPPPETGDPPHCCGYITLQLEIKPWLCCGTRIFPNLSEYQFHPVQMSQFLGPNFPQHHRTPVPGTGRTAPHRIRWLRGRAHRRASALSAYNMSWLKQPQKGQRVSSTEPSCMISCSIQRLEPIFEAILGKGSPLRPHPGLGD